ncbi:hypothetical protein OPV22_023031 [Ensete ventricosum]|uniref:Protein Asterix n=1 Tax=Ensete ventricosum TaxID=4639 RepID=A0AAV8QVR0_ENSVE|nr:hypothetical protein OPV22_023031 [Ensete ventricosum]
MKETTTSSSANDPRLPSAAKPYVPPTLSPQDLPIDYAGFLAVVFGVVGVTLRYKLCSWLAIIFCAESLANMKNFENDFKQLSMAFMFGVMGLGFGRPARGSGCTWLPSVARSATRSRSSPYPCYIVPPSPVCRVRPLSDHLRSFPRGFIEPFLRSMLWFA